jgi:osmotically-inducible protein OsmY
MEADMKSDSELQRDVLAELKWEPSVDHADIGVSVTDGVVTLNGHVKSYAEKLAAEHAASRVAGVKAIAQELKIRFASDPKTADDEIAKRILDMFRWNAVLPEDRIKVKVEHGWVSLTGNVDWNYQSREASKVVSMISGVVGVSNTLQVGKGTSPAEVRKLIEDAFRCQADLDARAVTVTMDGSKVKLGGNVHGWHERQVAERAAWSAPGVTQIEDQIRIV